MNDNNIQRTQLTPATIETIEEAITNTYDTLVSGLKNELPKHGEGLTEDLLRKAHIGCVHKVLNDIIDYDKPLTDEDDIEVTIKTGAFSL